MKYNHYCKTCEIYFAFFIEAEPITDEEKELCEENDSEELLREPQNAKEEILAGWYYSDDSDEYVVIPSNKEELEEYIFCDNCKVFIQRRW